MLYVISTVFISYLAFKTIRNPVTWNALFWIIMVFASVNAISKSFVQESKGRLIYFYTIASPQAVILSKIIYNGLLMICLSGVCFLFYALFIGSNIVQDIPLFLVVLFLGSLGFSSILTMVSAIASKTNSNFALMAILSFPLLVPLLLALMRVSKNAIDGLQLSVSYPYLAALVLLNIVVVVLSYLLFPYLWRE